MQTEDKVMATPITSVSLPALAPAALAVDTRAPRRRRISREAGHALEILGHAIEYLSDEFVHEGGSLYAGEPRLDAIQLLMALNRQVYFGCPVAPTLGQRIRAWLHRN